MQTTFQPNHWRLLLGFALLFGAITGCGGTPSLRQFDSPDGSFTISMPSEPKASTETVNTPDGPNQIFSYESSTSTAYYMVGYWDLKWDPSTEAQKQSALDRARDGGITAMQGHLLTEIIIQHRGYPGREVRFSVGSGTCLSRLFLVRNRIYEIIVSTSRDEIDSPQVAQYLSSFQLK